MNSLVKMTGPMVTAWSRLSAIQKAAISLISLLSIVALLVAFNVASRPQYSVLFSNLNANDANSIVVKLKETKTEYRLTNGGSAIEVPTKDVYDLRLQLAGAGLPQGGSVGFEIFDKSTFGMTEFTQKLDYQRALQGELARTIGELAPVDQARVHLAIPEQSLYSDQEKDSSASVVLKLKPGGSLDGDQVSAITHLVAAAVQGLKPGGVAVVDTAGNLLSDTNSGSLTASGLRLSSSQLEMQKQYENGVARDLQVMLEKVLGPGKSVVRVNARMNFDAKQSENEIYEPANGKNGVMIDQEQLKEQYTGAPRNIPGSPALSAMTAPGATATSSTSANGDNYLRTQNNNKYAVSKRVEHVTQSPFKIERLSVAVLLDGKITPVMQNTIQQTINSAVGIDSTRGDQVTVASLPFDNSTQKSEDTAMKQAANRDMMMTFGKWGVTLLLSIIFMLFMRSTLTRWKPIEGVEVYQAPMTVREAEMLNQGQVAAMTAEALPREERETEWVSNEVAEPAKRLSGRRAGEVAMERPEEVAKLLRSWLAEAA